MPWAPDYATLADLKQLLGITDTADDVALALALTGASRSIDHHTGRQFGVLAAAAARYYQGHYDSARRRQVAVIDDLMTTTSLVVKTDPTVEGTFDNTLALDTDFRLSPYNAPADGRPWTMMVLAAGETLPCRERSIEVTARYGWTAVPDAVEQAAMIQAARIFKRKDAPFGISGSPEMGSELRLLSKLDPDVAVLLSGYRRYWGAV